MCVVGRRMSVFLTDGRYKVQAPEEVRGFRTIISSAGMLRAAAERRVLPSKSRVGFEEEHVSVAELKNLRRLFPDVRFVPVVRLVESLAAVKDESEISMLRRAAAITDAVFTRILTVIRPGIRESEIAAEISYLHRAYGAEGDAFEPIVAGGPRGALPHARASLSKLRRGEMVILDFGCRVRGYHSDLTRTVAVGRPSARMRTIYQIVLEAQQRAIEAARAGIPARDLDAVARRLIRKRGYGKYFVHSLGHGLGLHVHEPLRLSALSKDMLQAGNVVTIEPGVYVPDLGGVRIEDDVVIRRDGCTVLTHSPKELMVV